MTRIKLIFPDNPIYKFKTIIGVGQINYGGHLGNDSVLTLFQDTRIAFFKSINRSEINIGNQLGLIQNDAAVQYLSEGSLHEEIQTELNISQTSKIGFDIFYKITSLTSNKVIAIGKTGMITYDYQQKKVAPIPKDFIEIIA